MITTPAIPHAERGRLARHPVLQFDRSRKVTIVFGNRKIDAYEGETVAAALYAAGVRIFSRSFKYHRPRGLLCVSGRCPNCLMNVDGRPNVRTCMEPVRDGMQVRHQNAWPSLSFDILSLIDRLDRFLPVGFYYKTFIRPRFLWPVYETVLRHLAGLGKIDLEREPERGCEKEYRSTDLTIVGGGPAGLSAAIEAARLGVTVTLIDDQPTLGGHLRTQICTYESPPEYSGRRGFEIATHLAHLVQRSEGIDLFSHATAFGLYEGNLLGVLKGRRLIELRTKGLIVATGVYEHPLVFENNDLPGIVLGSGVQRLMHLYGVIPGRRALVVTSNDFGLRVACDLLEAGVAVEAVVDARLHLPDPLAEVQRLKSAGVPLFQSHTIKAAKGRKHVTGAVVTAINRAGELVGGSERDFTCDLICVSTGFEPASALLSQSGCRLGYDAALGEFVVKELAPSVYAAGDVTGTHDLPGILLEGRIAGIQAALSLGVEAPSALGTCERYREELEQVKRFASERAIRPLLRVPGGGKKFVCLCEDVTEKDIRDAVQEGFDHIETLKRYTTISMGPCQGKMCAMASTWLCALETGRTVSETGTTTSRPPIQPVPLGALAGRGGEPYKVSSIHQRHVALGAKIMDLGLWKRPEFFTDPVEEVRAVHEAVGQIDVSSLGKLDVKGKDAVHLLEKVYPNRFTEMKVGRVRYGVICDEGGIILDDGTVCRLAEDHFFITTTTGGVDAIEQWLNWWLVGTALCAHVTNVTSALATINLAGPRSREVLSKLTELDLSPSSLPYLASARGKVAGVPTLILRIGFVGELGYEMHFPSEYGEYLWESLMEAGREYGIRPFGIEAQRILRLEKGHIIVGHDTDALSNPLEADMAWIVKFEKPDFIGRPSLVQVQQRGLRQKLVGFEMDDPTLVAEEGDQIVADGRLVGRVTSARFGPGVRKSIGMAWVPIEMAAQGAGIQIQVNGRVAAAKVVALPFYDPEGARMRA